MKVYCGNCKYYRHEFGDCIWICIRYYKTEKIVSEHESHYKKTFRTRVTSKYEAANRKNGNNDCSDYKRKWWKFWLITK